MRHLQNAPYRGKRLPPEKVDFLFFSIGRIAEKLRLFSYFLFSEMRTILKKGRVPECLKQHLLQIPLTEHEEISGKFSGFLHNVFERTDEQVESFFFCESSEKYEVHRGNLIFHKILNLLSLPQKQPQHQKEQERNIHRLETMQEQVHSQNPHERSEKSGREREEHPSDSPHNGTKEGESDDSSFDELLDVPAFRDIVVLGILYLPAVDGVFGKFHDIAISWSGGSESLPHRVLGESLESGNGSFEMPLGRAGTKYDPIDGSLVPEVEESREYHEKEYHYNTLFFVFPPDGSEGKYDKRQASKDYTYKRTARIGEENESEKDDRPEPEEEMVLFLGSEIVEKESRVDEEEIRRRVRSVKYSLKPFDPRSIDAVIDRRSSAETPIAEISGESKINENGFMEDETHEQSRKYGETRREKKYLEVPRNTSYEERTSVFRNEKRDEKFEIVAPTIDERCESESIHERDDDEVSDVRYDQIIEDVEFRKCFFLEIIPREQSDKEGEKNLFEETHSGNPELAPEKYGSEHTPREKDEEDAEDTVEHRRKRSRDKK